MMRGQIEEQRGDVAAAREFYNKAVSYIHCRSSLRLATYNM